MHIARDKHGRIGRHVKTLGETVDVSVAPTVDPHRHLIVDYITLEKNSEIIAREDAKNRQDYLKRLHMKHQKQVHEQKQFRELEKSAILSQKVKTMHPLEDALKAHFASQMNKSETDRVIRSIKADFTQNEMMPAKAWAPKVGVRNANFYSNEVVGNPLVRDGQYGVVTDFDRIVQGVELDNDTVVVGGTMIRSYGRTSKPQMGTKPDLSQSPGACVPRGACPQQDQIEPVNDVYLYEASTEVLDREMFDRDLFPDVTHTGHVEETLETINPEAEEMLNQAGQPKSSGAKKMLMAGAIAAGLYFLLGE